MPPVIWALLLLSFSQQTADRGPRRFQRSGGNDFSNDYIERSGAGETELDLNQSSPRLRRIHAR